MKISPENLSNELTRKLLSCYLISGDEPLLVQESHDLIRKKAYKEGFTIRETFDQTQTFDWQEIINSCSNMSLFSDKKIIEIRFASSKPGREAINSINELIARLNQDLMIIISMPKLDKASLSAKWCQNLQKKGAIIQIWPLKSGEFPYWLEKRINAAGLNASREVVLILADRVEGNLLAAAQAIEKLKLYLGDGNVSETVMQKVVSDDSRYDVYKLIDAILVGNIQLSLRILQSLRDESMDAVVIIWALNRELRLLSKLSFAIESGANQNEVMQSYRIWSSRQNIVSSCLNRHQLFDFHNMIKACTNADNVAKGQEQGDKWQLIKNIILHLSACDKAA